jgi:hypothetical protein
MTELKFLKKQLAEATKEWDKARKESNKEEAEYWQAQTQKLYARILVEALKEC